MPKYVDGAGLERFYGNIKEREVQTFDTVAAMQAATYLEAGMTCHTNGFHASGDGGAAYYTISASGTANGMDVLALQNSLLATLVVTEPYVTPEMFGAWGDGTHDDYDAIQSACTNGDTVTFAADKTYLVSSSDAKTIDVGTTSIVGNGAIMRLINTNVPRYSILTLSGGTISHLHIIGDSDENTSTGEWGMGITVNADNSAIDKCIIEKCFGDGIYVTNDADDIVIEGCEIKYCRRNGISVVDCDTILIADCFIHDIAGTSPMAAIDFESNYASEKYANAFVRNCVLLGSSNYQSAMVNINKGQQSNSVTFVNCVMGNVTLSLTANHYVDDGYVQESHVVPSSKVRFENCEIRKLNNTRPAIRITNDCDEINVDFIGCTVIANSDNSTAPLEGCIFSSYPVVINDNNVVVLTKNVYVNGLHAVGQFTNLYRPRSGCFIDPETFKVYDLVLQHVNNEQNDSYFRLFKYLTFTVEEVVTSTADGTVYMPESAINLSLGGSFTANHNYTLAVGGCALKTVENTGAYTAVPHSSSFIPSGWKLVVEGSEYTNAQVAQIQQQLNIPANSSRSFYCNATLKKVYVL